ncbi:hypothetical protein COT70_01605 [candidate division WWE3 bacterium CG09_land_8_20_14_0_10_47_33]|uniref:Uncharacterized protein n=1 Tax=candidate division WWE3 bacterium CG_4_9_14_0_2_um_filter_48_10 TaxID=1975078 RepID=A0A2M8EJF4_UNCKA|nr:MAG: hypothetical protein COT70_01605 [candidate division WWE3 bacterium CG09_land_8_20_14_0_10_47_33]PIZ41526.1 MAG: hypothetical protein COY35_00190 [candidate division WWE3 bacterium CG_4_10_14_0_2_um_filter_47_8]PJC22850.1 MAG: hypothetical protein CO059_01575 [candidate division WWE3 bacterium CG_4_9_14_0_2_um_filter_48_10]PJE51879.1 MAG: hypothetical protein COV28_01560 [candidate division WWE3 bacterium CG10_big_fil_rev_8_21_14_0_10_48_23]
MRSWGEKIKAVPWRKVGLGFLVFALVVLSFLGGYLAMNWYLGKKAAKPEAVDQYAGWQTYESKSYNFTLRYPQDWKAEEVKPTFILFSPQVSEEEENPQEYILLRIASNKTRGKTLCEEDQSKCSFHTNGIFGERTTTPETESVFFAHGENDFLLTLFKYKTDPGIITNYITVFEEMAESFRFVSEVITSCEKDADCALGIRLDKCCTCAEAFTTSEIEANLTIAPFEVGKDYSKEKTVSCTGIYCSPCPTPPSGAVCVSTRCRVTE